jgi:predicted dehydrogenase
VKLDRTKVAIVGAGYLGRQHARIYSELECAELVGVVDKNAQTADAVAKEFRTNAYTDYREVIGKVSAVSLAAPTTEHASLGCALLEQGIDVLVEKPIASSLGEAEALIRTARVNRRILQVGHLERFNPAVVAAREIARQPLFFEVHRLGVFTSRSLDIDVVFDLMIHDLDIVLDLVQSPVKSVSAVGLPILSSKIDIANARIEFQNGCVANLTASRVSTEKVRKLRFFQPNEYVSLDYTRQDVVALSVRPGEGEAGPIIVPRKIETARVEPLRAEIEAFLNSVRTRILPEVTPESSKQALELAQQVVERIRAHSQSLPIPIVHDGEGRTRRDWKV